MKIFLGSDHGGYELKEKVKAWLTEWGYELIDCGNTAFDAEDDYPDFAFRVGENVVKEPGSIGILACRSAGGMIIAANKVQGARAVAAFDETSARHCREHNNANILGLSGNWTGDAQAKQIVKTFVDTPFSEEDRHKRRVGKIVEYEEHNHKSIKT